MARRAVGLALRAARRLLAGGARNTQRPPPAVPGAPLRGPVAALVIDATGPRPDLDSGSVRMVALLRLLAETGLPPALIEDDRLAFNAAWAVPVVAAPGTRSLLEWIAAHRGVLKVVVLSRHTVAAHWLPAIRALLPETPVIFDTVDLHHLREARQAAHQRSRALQMLATLTAQREFALLRRADRTWVVSEVEQQLLRPRAGGAAVDVVSNIVDPLPDPPGFDARSGFVFVGNFRHEPNVDAVEWLLTLWPRIHESCADATLLVAGAGLTDAFAPRVAAVPGVRVLGHVPDLERLLQQTRVMLAPLRYGAGVKGKVHSAFAAGLAVAATSCAFEGMSDPDLIHADDDELFIARAVELYRDRDAWARAADAGRRCLASNFSRGAALRALRDSLHAAGVTTGGAG